MNRKHEAHKGRMYVYNYVCMNVRLQENNCEINKEKVEGVSGSNGSLHMQ